MRRRGGIVGRHASLAAVVAVALAANQILAAPATGPASATAETPAAEAWIERALDAAHEVPAGPSRDTLLSAIALLHAKRGNLDAAKAALSQISDGGATAALYVVSDLVLAGRLEAALALAEWKEDEASRDVGRMIVARTLASIGDIEGARATIATIASAASKRQAEEGIELYGDSAVERRLLHEATLRRRRGDFAGAAEAAAAMPEGTQRDLALRDLAVAQAKVGRVAAARRAMSAIERPGPMTLALIAIARAEAAAGDVDAARETLADAAVGAELARNDIERPILLAELAAGYAAVGDDEAYQGTMRRAEEAADALPMGLLRYFAYGSIVHARGRSGDVEGALALAERIGGDRLGAASLEEDGGRPEPDPDDGAATTPPDPDIFLYLGAGLAQALPPEALQRWLQGLEGPAARAHALAGIATALQEREEEERASAAARSNARD